MTTSLSPTLTRFSSKSDLNYLSVWDVFHYPLLLSIVSQVDLVLYLILSQAMQVLVNKHLWLQLDRSFMLAFRSGAINSNSILWASKYSICRVSSLPSYIIWRLLADTNVLTRSWILFLLVLWYFPMFDLYSACFRSLFENKIDETVFVLLKIDIRLSNIIKLNNRSAFHCEYVVPFSVASIVTR